MKDLRADDVQRVYRFALRLAGDHHTAEEIVQETFLRAWKGRSALRDAAAMRAWLFQIAANVWRDRLRNRKSPAGRTVPLAEHDRTHEISPERISAGDQEVDRIIQAMQALPARQHQVLYLFSIEGMSVADISKILAISPAATRSSLSLARQTLRGRLRELESAP